LADQGVTPVTTVILIIGIIHFLLPTQKINKFLFKVENIDELLDYEKASPNFDNVIF